MDTKLYNRFRCCLNNRSYSLTTPPCVKQTISGSNSASVSPIGGWSLYKAFSSMLSIPTVHADGPSATDRIAQNVDRQETVGYAKLITGEDIERFLTYETGRDRLRMMYTKDAAGNYSRDLMLMYGAILQSSGMTFLLMSLIGGRHAKEKFISSNQATVFKTKYMAMRQMTDSVFLQSLKDGVRWAFRVGLFSFSFLFISQSIAAYRNKSSLWEYIAGAMVTGGIFKMNLGLKGVVGGSILSGFGGVIAGVLIYGTMYVGSETQEQRHYWWVQHMLEQDRELAGRKRSPEEILKTYPLITQEKNLLTVPVDQ